MAEHDGDTREANGAGVRRVSVKLARDAKTGRFIPMKTAKQRPASTVVETVLRRVR